jgi:hypothetical protein
MLSGPVVKAWQEHAVFVRVDGWVGGLRGMLLAKRATMGAITRA